MDPARSLPRLLLVTGMSGAGKSSVLDALEDMGWDCVDNLPTALLHDFVHGEQSDDRVAPVAVGMDVRSRGFDRINCRTCLSRSRASSPKSSISTARALNSFGATTKPAESIRWPRIARRKTALPGNGL